LEPLASPGLAGLLAFAHTAVPSEESGGFQGAAEFFVEFFQGPGDTEPDGLCLADITAALHADLKVETPLLFRGLEGGVKFTLENFEAAVLLGLLAINFDKAFAFLEADTGDGALAAADRGENGVVSSSFHY
jgi:hypothetical protein